MKKIKLDIKTRLKNPMFWGHLFVSISLMCLSYFGLEINDLTTFPILWDLIKKVFSNPYVIIQIIWIIWTTIYNPLTKGLGDD